MSSTSTRVERIHARARNEYLEALAQIPRGSTRTFTELAALAGRPGAARAAGRAIAAVPTGSRLAWHRVVRAGGALAPDPSRATEQLKRLIREGARPREGEAAPDFARRRGRSWIGDLARKVYYGGEEQEALRISQLRVELFARESEARSRGFARRQGKQAERRKLWLPALRPIAKEGGALLDGQHIETRLDAIDWKQAHPSLAADGCVRFKGLLSARECAELGNLCASARFERSIDMLSRGFGIGVYHYFREPLPLPAARLRARLYEHLRPLAETKEKRSLPRTLASYWTLCRRSGQRRGACILIGYEEGGINHLHQDIYGQEWFPYQALLVLSRRGRDFDGGEFLLARVTRPAARSARAQVLAPKAIAVSEGDLVVFASHEFRHGMQQLTRGERWAIGLVFHLAR